MGFALYHNQSNNPAINQAIYDSYQTHLMRMSFDLFFHY